jgi:hypothetical protein
MHTPLRAATGIVVVALTVGLTALPAAAASPITPANRPTPLSGAVNGVVPSTRLVQVAPDCITAREAGPSLRRLFTLARAANVALGAEECYRALADQVRYANEAQQPGSNPACVASISRTPSGQPVGHSFHGWGKAGDFTDGGRSLTFASAGYAFMKQVAASVGWNHPAFAEPGGSTCPEPWHWEWVGDGGALHRDPVRADAVALLPSASGDGYGIVGGLGGLSAHGDFTAHGDAASLPLAWVVVGAAPTPQRTGYWMVGADGGVFTYGNAHFYGSLGDRPLNQPVNGIASTRRGRGYWLIAFDGGVFSFGDAHFYGSMGARRLVSPVLGIAPTPTGRGYWLVAGDGGVFSFGDAHFYGSMGGHRLNSPVVGMAPTPTGRGYWLVASDGGVFSFGDARFFGSTAPLHPTSPAVAIVAARHGDGYWLLQADGAVAAFGAANRFAAR